MTRASVQRVIGLLLVALALGISTMRALDCHDGLAQTAPTTRTVPDAGSQAGSGPVADVDVMVCEPAANQSFTVRSAYLMVLTSAVALLLAMAFLRWPQGDGGDGQRPGPAWRGRSPPWAQTPGLAVLSVLRI